MPAVPNDSRQRSVVHPRHRPPRRIGRARERGIPCDGSRRRTCDRFAARYRACAGIAREMLLEQAPVPARFLRLRWVDREAFGGSRELRVADMRLRMRLQPVDPAVADAVAELLLLPPQDRVGQVAGESLAQYALLDA